MKLKTSELTGAALDWAVMQCEGLTPTIEPDGYLHVGNVQWRPSRNWQDGGPIIEREVISLDYALCYGETGQEWEAVSVDDLKLGGPTPLIAAMRCYVATKLGDEVDVPDSIALDSLIYETEGEE